jgi:hypothetical protein
VNTITEETKTDLKNDLEVITENTNREWSGRMGVNGDMGGIEDLIETQLEKIRNVVKEKNGSVSDEVNEVLDRYEMEQTETNRKLEDLYGSWIDIQSYEGDIERRIVEVKNKIVELLEK